MSRTKNGYGRRGTPPGRKIQAVRWLNDPGHPIRSGLGPWHILWAGLHTVCGAVPLGTTALRENVDPNFNTRMCKSCLNNEARVKRASPRKKEITHETVAAALARFRKNGGEIKKIEIPEPPPGLLKAQPIKPSSRRGSKSGIGI